MVIPGQRGTEGPGNRPRGAAIRSSCRRGRGRCLGPRLRHGGSQLGGGDYARRGFGGAGASRAASETCMGASRQSHRLSGSGRPLKGAPPPSSRRYAMSLRSTLDRPSRPGHTKTVGKPPKERAGRRSEGRGHHRSPGPVPVGRSRDEAMTAPGPVGGSARFAARCSRPSARRPSVAGHKPPTTSIRRSTCVRRPSVAGPAPPRAAPGIARRSVRACQKGGLGAGF